MTARLKIPLAKLEIIELGLDQIRPDPRNPRLHGKRHVRQLAKSIEVFGSNLIKAELDDFKLGQWYF